MTTETTRPELDLLSFPFPHDDMLQPPCPYARLRREDPVTQVRLPSGDLAWLIPRYDHARTAFADKRFVRIGEDAARLTEDGGFDDTMNARPAQLSDHERWRKIVSKAFTPRYVETLRPRMQKIVDGLLDAMQEQGPPADLVEAYHFPLPMEVICELLGVPNTDQDRFRGWARDSVALTGRSPEDIARLNADMEGFFKELVERKRHEDGDDLLTQLVHLHDADAGKLTEAELLVTAHGLFIAGYETTGNALGKGMFALFRNPEQLAALRADRSLLHSAVEEMLRYAPLDSGYGIPRQTLVDVPLGDTVIPRGATVIVPHFAANRDPEQFADPDVFRVGRRPNAHLTLGHGRYFCIGAPLARVEMQIAVGSLLDRFPGLRLAVPPEEIRAHQNLITEGPVSLPVEW
ncbi:cytochrome P450 [Streptomyces sp. NPDC020192]|uniref:cytochrome P450 n=1 Tax=Streptomyces sp. NPDC020192 TaxID=3365066 RepID=UPI0037A0F9D0